jgi:hypothetical protein
MSQKESNRRSTSLDNEPPIAFDQSPKDQEEFPLSRAVLERISEGEEDPFNQRNSSAKKNSSSEAVFD